MEQEIRAKKNKMEFLQSRSLGGFSLTLFEPQGTLTKQDWDEAKNSGSLRD